MPTLARFRFLAAIVLACTVAGSPAMAAEGAPVARTQPPASYIVIGFVGGFVGHDVLLPKASEASRRDVRRCVEDSPE